MIILSGGGTDFQTTEVYEFYSGVIDHQKPILYIPLAIETDDYSSCLNWIESELGRYGLRDIRMVSEVNELNNMDFNSYSSIFIGGGNTYRLLAILKESGIFNKIQSYIDGDGIVLGGSAGAIIFGRDIGTSAFEDNNDCNLLEFSGYDELQGYSLLCHYDSEDRNLDEFIHEYLRQHNKLIALPEETSIVIDNIVLRIIGQKACVVYYDGVKETIQPGNVLEL